MDWSAKVDQWAQEPAGACEWPWTLNPNNEATQDLEQQAWEDLRERGATAATPSPSKPHRSQFLEHEDRNHVRVPAPREDRRAATHNRRQEARTLKFWPKVLRPSTYGSKRETKGGNCTSPSRRAPTTTTRGTAPATRRPASRQSMNKPWGGQPREILKIQPWKCQGQF